MPAWRATLQRLQEATSRVASNGREDPDQAGAVATPYLRLTALTVTGYWWWRMVASAERALQAATCHRALLQRKRYSARFCFDKVLPDSEGLFRDVLGGKVALMPAEDSTERCVRPKPGRQKMPPGVMSITRVLALARQQQPQCPSATLLDRELAP